MLSWFWIILVMVLVVPVGWGWIWTATFYLWRGDTPTRDEVRVLVVLTVVFFAVVGIGGALGIVPPSD